MLSVCHRIDFKILLQISKVLKVLGPKYISDLLLYYEPEQVCFPSLEFHFHISQICNNLPESSRSVAVLTFLKSPLTTFCYCLLQLLTLSAFTIVFLIFYSIVFILNFCLNLFNLNSFLLAYFFYIYIVFKCHLCFM